MAYLFPELIEEARGQIYSATIAVFGNVIEKGAIEVSLAKDGSHGDISTPVAFKLASILKKSPIEISGKLEEQVNKSLNGIGSHFESAKSLNGFLNFTLANAAYAESLSQASKAGKGFGKSASGKGKKAIVEFSSPNIGKPMHIGHIRSTILGDSLARVLRLCGYKVISSNYLCEAGLQTAKLLLALQRFKTKEIESEKDLLELYVKIHKELEDDPDLEKHAQELVFKMETGDAATLRELSKVRTLSTAPFERNYRMLDVEFDEEVFDSDYVADGKKLAQEAVGKGVAFQDTNGEVVAELEKLGLPNLIILRSNGTTLYSTRDLGLAERQSKKHNFDTRIYVTASEQNLHFKQAFAILGALGRPYAKNLRHIGFGLISLEEGKLSTREGRVLLLEDVISDAISMALEEVEKRQQYSKEDASAIARIVGIAALKYSVLRISSEKDIKFSLREAVKFDGNTAAYLQYMSVRAKNILRKAKEEEGGKGRGGRNKSKSSAYQFSPEERSLILHISQFPEAVEHAARNLAPYIICEYLFKLALQFSVFYDSMPVLKAQTKESREMRLEMVKATQNTLESGLALLGISIPEKM